MERRWEPGATRARRGGDASTRHEAPYPAIDAVTAGCGSWKLVDNVCCAQYCSDDPSKAPLRDAARAGIVHRIPGKRVICFFLPVVAATLLRLLLVEIWPPAVPGTTTVGFLLPLVVGVAIGVRLPCRWTPVDASPALVHAPEQLTADEQRAREIRVKKLISVSRVVVVVCGLQAALSMVLPLSPWLPPVFLAWCVTLVFLANWAPSATSDTCQDHVSALPSPHASLTTRKARPRRPRVPM